MTDAGRRTGFTQKTKPRRFVAEIFFADDFQGHGVSQIDIEGLVGDTHSAATQLDRSAILIQRQFIVLKASNLQRTVCLPGAVC